MTVRAAAAAIAASYPLPIEVMAHSGPHSPNAMTVLAAAYSVERLGSPFIRTFIDPNAHIQWLADERVMMLSVVIMAAWQADQDEQAGREREARRGPDPGGRLRRPGRHHGRRRLLRQLGRQLLRLVRRARGASWWREFPSARPPPSRRGRWCARDRKSVV